MKAYTWEQLNERARSWAYLYYGQTPYLTRWLYNCHGNRVA